MTARNLLRAALIPLIIHAFPALPQDGDAARGEGVFISRCSACHTVKGAEIKGGPPLTGLIGRTAGTWDGFAYSDAMRQSGIVWSVEILTEFLVRPKTVVPKTRMNFNGLKRPGEKEDLIAYLVAATAG